MMMVAAMGSQPSQSGGSYEVSTCIISGANVLVSGQVCSDASLEEVSLDRRIATWALLGCTHEIEFTQGLYDKDWRLGNENVRQSLQLTHLSIGG